MSQASRKRHAGKNYFYPCGDHPVGPKGIEFWAYDDKGSLIGVVKMLPKSISVARSRQQNWRRYRIADAIEKLLGE